MNEKNFKKFLIQIWPTVYRTINTLIYALLHFLKSIISLAIDQLKGR
ncbi:MAG TPA: hypothetical protein VFD45_01145 [Patescibacteria group bacterium]|nr:hypothetical protein [Patescibacteria group bacterium]